MQNAPLPFVPPGDVLLASEPCEVFLALTLVDLSEDIDDVHSKLGIIPLDRYTGLVRVQCVQREIAQGVRNETLVNYKYGVHECSEIL